ncbi:hypothetical protein GCM10027347_44670 [Larkinella harenae]
MDKKTFEQLFPNDEVVVQFGPRTVEVGRKLQEVDPPRNVIMTVAGWESIDRDEAGEPIHTPAKLLGMPAYKTVVDPKSPTGKRKDYDIIPFAEEGELEVEEDSLPETEEAEVERFMNATSGLAKNSKAYKEAKLQHEDNLARIKAAQEDSGNEDPQ